MFNQDLYAAPRQESEALHFPQTDHLAPPPIQKQNIFISRIVYILLGRGVMFGREGLPEQITPKQTFKSRNNGFNHKEKDFFVGFSEEITM